MGSSPHTRGAHRDRDALPDQYRDHPRIRGEHRHPGEQPRIRPGIIPAYAGSTLSETGDALREVGSSPHTRGAPSPRLNLLCPYWGSYPHTRGARMTWPVRLGSPGDHPRIRGEHVQELANRRWYDGIIPAYAGSTLRTSSGLSVQSGSSPHTRGARRPTRRTGRSLGDHPRIRGEHT